MSSWARCKFLEQLNLTNKGEQIQKVGSNYGGISIIQLYIKKYGFHLRHSFETNCFKNISFCSQLADRDRRVLTSRLWFSEKCRQTKTCHWYSQLAIHETKNIGNLSTIILIKKGLKKKMQCILFNQIIYIQYDIRGGCRDFEKGGSSRSATMVGRRKKIQVSDVVKRLK